MPIKYLLLWIDLNAITYFLTRRVPNSILYQFGYFSEHNNSSTSTSDKKSTGNKWTLEFGYCDLVQPSSVHFTSRINVFGFKTSILTRATYFKRARIVKTYIWPNAVHAHLNEQPRRGFVGVRLKLQFESSVTKRNSSTAEYHLFWEDVIFLQLFISVRLRLFFWHSFNSVPP